MYMQKKLGHSIWIIANTFKHTFSRILSKNKMTERNQVVQKKNNRNFNKCKK